MNYIRYIYINFTQKLTESKSLIFTLYKKWRGIAGKRPNFGVKLKKLKLSVFL